FELAIKRQDLGKTPFRVAPRRPFVEILRRAAQRYMAVDGGGTAGNLAPRIRDFAIGTDLGDEAPVVRTSGDPGAQEIVGALLDGRVIGAGFDQQHTAVGVLAEAGGEHRAGGTRTHHDVIIIHDRLVRFRDGRLLVRSTTGCKRFQPAAGARTESRRRATFFFDAAATTETLSESMRPRIGMLAMK